MRGSRIFFVMGGGGGGGSGSTARKQPEQCFFVVRNLFYSLQSGSNGFITEETILFQGSSFQGGGVQLFPGGGGPPLPGGPNAHFYRNSYNL